MKNVLVIKEVAANPDLFEKLFPTLVSVTFVVLLFIIGRLIDSKIKRKDIKRGWYQKVIIDPNINKINSFYNNLVKQIGKSIANLKDQKDKLIFNEYIVIKAKEAEKVKRIVRKFDLEFVQLVDLNYPLVAVELRTHIMQIQDDLLKMIDRPDLGEHQYDEIESKVSESKSKMYGFLFIPLELKFKLCKAKKQQARLR